ncbi:OB-fold nucleic acid binding domain-containing protein [Bowdeniella nasicola]|nr:OB-fold nucleic acid binding domain-containing protein [Bowdeniella nasicola]
MSTTIASAALPMSQLNPRMRARVAGRITAVTYRPSTRHPELRAQLSDDTGSIGLVFHGRRAIAGIEPGRYLMATGTVASSPDGNLMFDPEYRLLIAKEESS